MSRYVDETYFKVRGRRCYLYRAIERDGNLIDAMLSQRRDMLAARAFFRSARATMGFRPDRVTTYRHDKCLNKATSGRWAAVGDEVRLDEAGCRIALIRKGPHGHAPPHRG